MAKLRAKLALEKEERRKAQEEVNAAMKRAVQDFKSSKDMEDIIIDFTQESFLEGFWICLGWVIENFPNIDLDLLIEELENRASPSHADANVAPTAYAVEVTLKVLEPASVASRPARELKVVENVPTSPVGEPPEV
ncbi:hypothetical protein COCNU_scaffold002951G000010 [Cocos nucifera]|nr:hypothetical protein [Cocos nucifera]